MPSLTSCHPIRYQGAARGFGWMPWVTLSIGGILHFFMVVWFAMAGFGHSLVHAELSACGVSIHVLACAALDRTTKREMGGGRNECGLRTLWTCLGRACSSRGVGVDRNGRPA